FRIQHALIREGVSHGPLAENPRTSYKVRRPSLLYKAGSGRDRGPYHLLHFHSVLIGRLQSLHPSLQSTTGGGAEGNSTNISEVHRSKTLRISSDGGITLAERTV